MIHHMSEQQLFDDTVIKSQYAKQKYVTSIHIMDYTNSLAEIGGFVIIAA